MKWLLSIAVAFGMYSRIPVPSVAWREDSMRYALCAFPLIGVAQGLLCVAWGALCLALGIPALLCAAGFLALPLLVNGGIHLDGLADTSDALASHAPRERMLEIMKDSHLGAFGAIALCVHAILLFAVFASWRFDAVSLWCLPCIFALSRALSGWAITFWPQARKQGMARSFSDGASRTAVGVFAALFSLAAAAGLVVAGGIAGGAAVAAALLMVAYYRHIARSRFGGGTGDVAGWFLQWTEFACIAVLAAGGAIA